MAPGCFKEDFPKAHAEIGIVWVGDVDIGVEVFRGDSNDRNSHHVVEVFVVVADEITVSFHAND